MNAAAAEQLAPALERYRSAFETRWPNAPAARRRALEEFLARGFPTPRDEDWKYTNLRRLESRSFQPAAQPSIVSAQPADFIACAGARIVFVDGHWSHALSSNAVHAPGVTVANLGAWFAREPDAAHSRLDASVLRQSSIERLNAAFCEDGVLIELAPNAQPDEPLYIVHQWSAHAAGRMSCPRIIVRAGRGSRLTLIEQYLGPVEAESFTNAVTTLHIEANACIEHYRLQQESTRSFHLGHIDAHLAEHATYTAHDVALGASLGRTDAAAVLAGSGAHAAIHGLFAPDGLQHLDAHTRIEHAAPHTTSYEDYRGVAAGRGRGVFNGKVLVRPAAQKTDAQQSSRNLLLSPTAEIDAKPELEIYANDVKCSHGATTGQLDATALFYLRSRGVSEIEARALLIRAFAESILTSVEVPALREYLEQRLDARFAIATETQP